MSALSEHTAVIRWMDGDTARTLPVKQIVVSADEEHVPFWGLDVICPLGDGAVLNIDPTDRILYADVELRAIHGRVDRIRDLTRRYRDRQLAFISDQFDGDQVSDITKSLYHDYDNPGAARDDDTVTLTLSFRSIDVDEAAATVTFRMASGEAIARDHDRVAISDERVAGADLVAKLNTAFEPLGLGPIDFVDTRTPGIPADADIGDEAVWHPGQSLWDWAIGLAGAHGYDLWCDAQHHWHLWQDRDSQRSLAVFTAQGEDRSVVNARWKRDRDNGWYTAVFDTYDAQDGAKTYDVATITSAWPHKAFTRTFDHAPAASDEGRAFRTLAYLTRRGRDLTITAINRYDIEPGQQVRYDGPTGSYLGRIASIAWRLPEDEMDIKLRDVTRRPA